MNDIIDLYDRMSLLQKKIPRGVIYHSAGDSLRYLASALISPLDNGELVSELETTFASYSQRQFCTAFPFARTAIHAILKRLNLPQGSEVLLPPITIKGIVDVVLDLGLAPRYVDLDPDTICFDIEELKRGLLPQVRVAIVTPLFGLVPDMEAIVDLLKRHDIYIIEDFSQCLNGRYDDKRIGTFGDAAVFSASSIKTLDTLGGGFAITDDPVLHAHLKEEQAKLAPPSRRFLVKKAWINFVRNIATTNPFFSWLTFPLLQLQRRTHPTSALKQTGHRDKSRLSKLPELWFTRYTSVQAQIGLGQIGRVQAQDEARIANVNQIKASAPRAQFPRTTLKSHNVYWQLILHADDAARQQQYFAEHGIDIATSSLELVCALEAYPNRAVLKVANSIYTDGIFIPCYPNLQRMDIQRIVEAIQKQ